MTEEDNSEQAITNPTYLEHIRYFFEQQDIDCMNRELVDFDLSTYEGVKKNANRIFAQTLQPRGKMPPQVDRKWSKERSETFRNWILNDFPMGVPVASPVPTANTNAKSRVRKDIRDLSEAELKKLKEAFTTLKARDHNDSNSFFAVAKIHGMPEREYCLHHELAFHPWHRAYLKVMEDALRTVPGCEDVTLPYWDISGTTPAVLYDAPFDGYTLPVDADRVYYPKGYQTRRDNRSDIDAGLVAYQMAQKIQRGLSRPHFEQANDRLEACHDTGHSICGDTISDANVTAYDPMFWFFHCNWDRLWWRWQHAVGATDLVSFKSTLQSNPYWLSPPSNEIEPFGSITTDKTINVADLHYAPSRDDQPILIEKVGFGNVKALASFSLPAPDRVSVRVKGIKRLNIEGSFVVSLMAGKKEIDHEGFFQSRTPQRCGTCRKNDTINIDFDVPVSMLQSEELQVVINKVGAGAKRSRVSLEKAGNPTVNIRHLIGGE